MTPMRIEAVRDVLGRPVFDPSLTGPGVLWFVDPLPHASWDHRCYYVFLHRGRLLTVPHVRPPAEEIEP
jgi:hypothetical protein